MASKKETQELTHYEKARIVGARALQLTMGAPPLVKADKSVFSAVKLAYAEFLAGVIPLRVIRATA